MLLSLYFLGSSTPFEVNTKADTLATSFYMFAAAALAWLTVRDVRTVDPVVSITKGLSSVALLLLAVSGLAASATGNYAWVGFLSAWFLASTLAVVDGLLNFWGKGSCWERQQRQV